MPVQTHADDETPAFGRSMLGSKKTSDVKARITDESKFALQRRCHELGVSESEYVSHLIEVSLFGLDHVEMMRREQLNAVVALFPSRAQQ
jgi:hypothetical protein